MSTNILSRLLNSRKVIVALLTLLVNLVVAAFPSLAPHAEVITQITLVLAGMLIFSIAAEDIAKFTALKSNSSLDAIKTLLEELLNALSEPDEEETPQG